MSDEKEPRAPGNEKAGAASDGGAASVTRRIVYNDTIVRWFVIASVGWGIVGMLLGALIALQLAFHQANVHEFLSYGRLRPLHTNAVIFAFVGNMIFAGIYYSTQRLVKARLASDFLSKFHFWGWQAIIVAAAVTLPLGFTQAKEYAELEWPIDLAIAVVWVAFAVNFFWTLARRAERHLYVAIWFYIATIVTVTVLHVVNSLSIPVAGLKSYSIFGGAQDALVQWWYGHNAVAFFLTTPVLGIMYYFIPKAADRPVYSYRLSIVHFWALVFLYIWAGPHHLLNTALPDWAQTLGMVFSLMLWAPSWGGMLNGLLTLRGAWGKVRTDPVLKFLAAGVTFYGMATFEGPLLSIRSVSGLAHYTDWIIGHVHSGALGWNGFMAAGMFYWLVPRMWGTKLHSPKLADLHFYIGTIGILLYMVSMWVSGVTQGLMWRAFDAKGSPVYTFVETVIAIRPMYWTRLVGGLMYITGWVFMIYNLWRTAKSGAPVEAHADVVVPEEEPRRRWTEIVFGQPVVTAFLALLIVLALGRADAVTAMVWVVLLVIVGAGGIILYAAVSGDGRPKWHRMLEGRALIFTVLTVGAVLIGGIVQIVPTLLMKPAPEDAASTHVYTALQIEGRDVYLKEGCYTCHSQMIRPLDFETKRYGDASTLAESRYDHPFQWGSKRTGPDLAREGVLNPSPAWHYKHLQDPRSLTEGSNMPPYPHLATNKVDFSRTPAKLNAMSIVGVPYTSAQIDGATGDAKAEGEKLAKTLEDQGIEVAPDSEMVALIAYLTSLGVPLPAAPPPPPEKSGSPVTAMR